jgi:hypothetical protein
MRKLLAALLATTALIGGSVPSVAAPQNPPGINMAPGWVASAHTMDADGSVYPDPVYRWIDDGRTGMWILDYLYFEPGDQALITRMVPTWTGSVWLEEGHTYRIGDFIDRFGGTGLPTCQIRLDLGKQPVMDVKDLKFQNEVKEAKKRSFLQEMLSGGHTNNNHEILAAATGPIKVTKSGWIRLDYSQHCRDVDDARDLAIRIGDFKADPTQKDQRFDEALRLRRSSGGAKADIWMKSGIGSQLVLLDDATGRGVNLDADTVYHNAAYSPTQRLGRAQVAAITSMDDLKAAARGSQSWTINALRADGQGKTLATASVQLEQPDFALAQTRMDFRPTMMSADKQFQVTKPGLQVIMAAFAPDQMSMLHSDGFIVALVDPTDPNAEQSVLWDGSMDSYKFFGEAKVMFVNIDKPGSYILRVIPKDPDHLVPQTRTGEASLAAVGWQRLKFFLRGAGSDQFHEI